MGGLEGFQTLDDGIDGLIKGGRSGSDAHVLSGGEPRGLQLGIALDLQHLRPERGGLFGELTRVVAVPATDDDDVVTVPAKVFEGCLTLFGGMTDRVDETHLTGREALFDRGDESQRHFDRLRGL